MEHDRTLYDVLEVTPTSSQQEIRQAYIRLSGDHKGDVMVHAQLRQAYMVLGSLSARVEYDTASDKMALYPSLDECIAAELAYHKRIALGAQDRYDYWVQALREVAGKAHVQPESLLVIRYDDLGRELLAGWDEASKFAARYLGEHPPNRWRLPCPVCALGRLVRSIAGLLGISRQ